MGQLFAAGSWGEDATPERLLEGRHYKRLRAWAQPKVSANANDAPAAYYLASVKEAFGDLDGALALAEKALSLDANNARYHLLVADICIEQGQKVSIFKGMGLARRFRDEATKAASLDPRYVDARESLMEFYFEAPGIAGGDKTKAWALAAEIGKIDAARGFLAQASLSGKEKNTAKADEAYQKALAAAPQDMRVLREAAVFYVSDAEKQYDRAEKYARDELKLDVGDASPYETLAIVYSNGQRWSDLEVIIAQSEKNVPDNFGPHYQAGKVLATSGKDLPRAERYFRKYLTNEPEGGEPNLAAAHWRLGQVLEKEGRKSDAVAEMKEAVRLQPDFKPAKEDLSRLRK